MTGSNIDAVATPVLVVYVMFQGSIYAKLESVSSQYAWSLLCMCVPCGASGRVLASGLKGREFNPRLVRRWKYIPVSTTGLPKAIYANGCGMC